MRRLRRRGVGFDDQPCTSCDGGSVPVSRMRRCRSRPAPITRRLLGGGFDGCERAVHGVRSRCPVAGAPRRLRARSGTAMSKAKADATARMTRTQLPPHPSPVTDQDVSWRCIGAPPQAITREPREKDWQTTDAIPARPQAGQFLPGGRRSGCAGNGSATTVDAYHRKQVETRRKESAQGPRGQEGGEVGGPRWPAGTVVTTSVRRRNQCRRVDRRR